MDHWGRVGIDPVVQEWARGKLREEVGAFADDPHGYCGGDISFVAAWRHLEHLGRQLFVDVRAVLLEDRSDHEVRRLGGLVGRDFSKEDDAPPTW